MSKTPIADLTIAGTGFLKIGAASLQEGAVQLLNTVFAEVGATGSLMGPTGMGGGPLAQLVQPVPTVWSDRSAQPA